MVSPPLWVRASWRFFTRHPWQLGLTLLSIALGTAVIVAVDLANMTARQSFGESVSRLSGPMTHEIVAPRGAIPETLYTRLRVDWGYRNSVPLVEGVVTIAGLNYTLLGIDPFAYQAQTHSNMAVPASAIPRLLTEPNSVLISSTLAKRINKAVDEMIEVRIGGRLVALTLIGLLDAEQDARLNEVILTDIGSAQTLLQQSGQLNRVQLLLSEAEAGRLEALLPGSLQLVSFARQQQSYTQMTRAFSINLTAMSLLAMLVGAFLVYNTMTFSVLQRRQSFSITRMVGTTSGQLFRQLLLEAVVLGLLGSVLGVLLGIALGQGLLVLISQTMSDLFVSVNAETLLVTPLHIAKGIGITLLAVIAATLAPALEAARVNPVRVYRASQLEHSNKRMTRWLLLAGVLCMALSPLLIAASSRGLVIGFSALFLFIIGYSLMVPSLLRLVLHALQALPLIKSFNLRIAIRSVQASLSRTGLAIIALSIAVSATIGVSIMIGSFRASVADWLELTLQSDIYISADSESRIKRSLDPQWLQRVQALPQVASVSTGYDQRVNIDGMPVPMLVLQPGEQSARGFEYIEGEAAEAWQAFLNDEVILVSEPFAYHQEVHAGDMLAIESGQQGLISLRIAAVYRDYSATQGMLVLPRRVYDRYWDDPAITSLGVMLKTEADVTAVMQQLQSLAAEIDDGVLIRSNRMIRDYSLAIFDRTFAITHVLRLLVVIVAFVGVFSALMALFLEKGRDYAILRATGVTPAQLRTQVLWQSSLIGLLAGVLALPLGWLMSDILIEVINRRSFGWTMHSVFFVSVPFQALLLSISAALLASWYPTRRISRMSLRRGLHDL